MPISIKDCLKGVSMIIKKHFSSLTCLLELCDIGLPSQCGGVYMLDTSQTQKTLSRQNQVAIVMWNQMERPVLEDKLYHKKQMASESYS